jgi:hypothetical protein
MLVVLVVAGPGIQCVVELWGLRRFGNRGAGETSDRHFLEVLIG